MTKPHLSPRQAEVLQLCAQGKPTKVIARELGITPESVKDHRAAIIARFGESTMIGVVAAAFRLGMVS